MRILAVVLSAALSLACNAQLTFAADFDGTWQAGGEPQPGSEQFCGDWFVRLVVFEGRPSGFVSVGAGFLPLQNIVLKSDGSFTATAAGVRPSGHNRSPAEAFIPIMRISPAVLNATPQNGPGRGAECARRGDVDFGEKVALVSPGK